MDKFVFSVLLVSSVALFHSCEANTTFARGYVLSAPKWLLAEETESACLSLHNLEPPAHVLLELLSPASVQEEEVLASTSNSKAGIETCLELFVPATKYPKGRLRLKINFEKYPNYVVESEKEVYIEHDSLITFVETDKPVYKPGQDVNIRILMLKHDLKPWRQVIPKVWIENPSKVRVAQWTNVSTENGMAQLVFPLSPEPSSGAWKIKVEKKENYPRLIHRTTFEVMKYVLPRFQLTINSPGFILADAENVTWNVCAKYSYGKPVKGTLFLKSMPQTPSWKRHNLPEIYYWTELDSPDGCTEFMLSREILGLGRWKVAPNNILLTANFTEAGTGVVETAVSRTVVMHQALKLAFEPYTPKYFKLGLPYNGKLRVLRHDDTPAPNEKIQICLKVRENNEPIKVVVECRNFTSSVDGFLDFIAIPPNKNIFQLSFVATSTAYPTKYYSPDKRWRVFMDQPSANINVNSWYSPSYSYLSVVRGYQPIVCGEKYSFNVMYTLPSDFENNKPISFHYSINSKGDLLIYGHVKHKPSRDSILNYSEFRNVLGAVESPANKTEQNTVVHRFPLSVKVTPSMAPVSELLLYYVRSEGEIIATTYTIEVGHCFENKVKSAWHTDVQAPGSSTQYHVEAAPWSLCGISAVDKSTIFLGESKANLVDAGQAFDQLKRFHPIPKSGPLPWSYCKLEKPVEVMDHVLWLQKRKRRSANDEFTVDAMKAFDDFGVVVMSNLLLETRPCLRFLAHQRDIYTSMSPEVMDRHDIGQNMESFASLQAVKMPLVVSFMNYAVTEPPILASEVEYVDQLPDQGASLRSYFPETWLWDLVPVGKEGKVTIKPTLPDTITDWVGYTTCISPTHGLGIAPPTTLTAFQPFFLDYSLPYSVKRGEMLRMKVSLFNYMQHNLPVKIKLEEVAGLDLHLSHPVASFCVKSRDSIFHEYILRPRVLGEVNITVSASIDIEYSEPCGPETLIFTRDVIVKPILILPEGFPMDVTKSAFICPKDFSDDSAIIWSLELPVDGVPDSARAYVNLIGDILGPALENLDKLVRLPMGCAEQNMVLLVPNIHVIRYLDAVKIENPALKNKALKNMEKGYQRELNYRHPDGSYSAFGPTSRGDESSIWLTAFVLKSFAQARSLIHIDDREIKLSVKWIIKKQLENGCFPILGRVFHKDMKGGLQDDSSSSALTAYILIALLETNVPLSPSLINNALHCLEKGMANSNDGPYTTVLSTYALALLEHPKANSSIKALMDLATRYKDLIWWEDKTKPSMSLSIEMTAYAILSLVKLGGEENLIAALKAVRWLSKQRNAEGGFISTQDTVLGLEALTKYAMVVSTNNTNLSVLVTAEEVEHVYRMNDESRMVLTQIRLPVLPTVVEIFAEGEGCVLVQTNIKYNVAHATGSEAFDLMVAAPSVLHGAECSMQEITVCARYKMADEESNMALLEIGMISGYTPDRATLHALLGDSSTKVKRFEEDNDIVTIYFDKLTGQKTCISFTVTREVYVDYLEPANVKLYDYYQQELTISSSYNFAPVCSSAAPSEKQTVQNLMSLESKNSLAKDVTTDKSLILDVKDEIIEKSNGNNNINNKNNKTNSKFTSLKAPNSFNKLRDNTKTEEASITGVRAKIDNVPFVESSNLKMNEDDLESPAPVRTTNDKSIVIDHWNTPQVESGSGVTPDEPDANLSGNLDNFNFNTGTSDNMENLSTVFTKDTDSSKVPARSSFVVINHELETPEGVEGPVPVYVRPDTFNYKTETTVNVTALPDLVSTPKIINQFKKKEQEEPSSVTDINVFDSSATGAKQSCPTCSDKLPSDISNIYCSAKSAVKAAIRLFHKVRLLLDLHSSREVRRLRAPIEFSLSPNCSCPVLQSFGSLALILNKDNDILTPVDPKQILNDSFFIYGLPSTYGVPPDITEARAACSNEGRNQSIYTDPSVGG